MTPNATGWHLTWQDPVALIVVVLVLVGTWWLRRRLARTGCHGCAHAEAHGQVTESAPNSVIPLSSLRMSRLSGSSDGD